MNQDFAVTEAEYRDLERIARFLSANGVAADEEWDELCACVDPATAGAGKDRPLIAIDRGGAVRGFCMARDRDDCTGTLHLPILVVEQGPNGPDIYRAIRTHLEDVARRRRCDKIHIARLEPDRLRDTPPGGEAGTSLPVEIRRPG